MTLRAVLVIALRFYAISYVIDFLAVATAWLPAFLKTQSMTGGGWMILLPFASFPILALFFWFSAGRLAAGFARGIDGDIVFRVDLEEACVLAFVCLGLYFMLAGVAPLLIAIFQLLQMDQFHAHTEDYQIKLIQQAERWGIEFFAGLASLAGARKWARLIARPRSKAE